VRLQILGGLAALLIVGCAEKEDTGIPAGQRDDDRDGFTASEDCDDSDPAINPAQDELCDGVDNNCDDTIDEPSAIDAAIWYADADQDGFGDPNVSEPACEQPAGSLSDNTDCDDTSALTFPGAFDPPADGIDQNCDGADRCAEPDSVKGDIEISTSTDASPFRESHPFHREHVEGPLPDPDARLPPI